MLQPTLEQGLPAEWGRQMCQSRVAFCASANRYRADRGHSRSRGAAGETEAELLKAYPQLSKADLMAVWEYAARAAAEEIVLAES